MLHLLKIEYLKVKNYTTFWVICLLYLVIVPLIFLGICDGASKVIPAPFGPEFGGYLSFPNVWGNVVYTASWLNVLLGILVIVLTTNELTFRTQRQHIIEGISRRNVILAKMFALVVLAFGVAFYTFILGFIFGAIYSDIGNFTSGLSAILTYFVQTVGYFSMAFLLAVLLQRTAVSIIVFILVLLINLFIPGMVGDVIATYLPVSVISDLTPVPFRDEFYALQLSQGAILEIPELMAQEIRTTIATAYIILFGVIGFIVLKKRDL